MQHSPLLWLVGKAGCSLSSVDFIGSLSGPDDATHPGSVNSYPKSRLDSIESAGLNLHFKWFTQGTMSIACLWRCECRLFLATIRQPQVHVVRHLISVLVVANCDPMEPICDKVGLYSILIIFSFP